MLDSFALDATIPISPPTPKPCTLNPTSLALSEDINLELQGPPGFLGFLIKVSSNVLAFNFGEASKEMGVDLIQVR